VVEPCDGVLIVDKEEGETSSSVVREVKKLLQVSKVGHAGTLDPFATGLLLVLIGQGTKLSPYLMAGDKTYYGTLTLGTETDTLDRTGRVTNVKTVPKLDPELVRERAKAFVGETEQTPPVVLGSEGAGEEGLCAGAKRIAGEPGEAAGEDHGMDRPVAGSP
jgi:tRNA pseudouridine55 synthase